MNLSSQYEDAKLDLQISPLIDVVFLLLIYFIVSAKIIQPEGDIPFTLPAENESEMVDLPVEARIKIMEDNSVTINNGVKYPGDDADLKDLTDRLKELRRMAKAQRSPFFVTLDPTQKTKHTRIVDVMDACAYAEVKNLTFSRNDS